MNKVILIGRLTKDPEIKYLSSGKAVATFTLAVDRRSSGAEKTADFIPIVAWERLAETCGNHLSKGRLVSVEGRLQIRSYDTNEGQKRWVSEVVIHDMQFLGSKADTAKASSKSGYGGMTVNDSGKDVFPEDEIPF